MSLLKECSTLRHHSLESYIMEQSQGDQAYRLLEITQHPEIKTISDKVKELLDIFCSQTYQSLKRRKSGITLSDKQVRSLRKLSILSEFQGKSLVAVNTLCKQLEVDKLSLYKLMTEMSSKNLISVKIDDRNNKCAIFACTRRRLMSSKAEGLNAECQARLQKILEANNKLIGALSRSQ